MTSRLLQHAAFMPPQDTRSVLDLDKRLCVERPSQSYAALPRRTGQRRTSTDGQATHRRSPRSEEQAAPFDAVAASASSYGTSAAGPRAPGEFVPPAPTQDSSRARFQPLISRVYFLDQLVTLRHRRATQSGLSHLSDCVLSGHKRRAR